MNAKTIILRLLSEDPAVAPSKPATKPATTPRPAPKPDQPKKFDPWRKRDIKPNEAPRPKACKP